MPSATTVPVKMAQRRDTAANWTSVNPTLLAGEIGLESDTGYWKVGDGSTAWTSLSYVSGLGGEIPVSRLADGSARQLLQTAANGTDVEWTSNVDVPGTLDVTGAATFDNNVIIQGDLTVNGTETIINTQTLDVEDKNIVIGKVTTPSDVTADGGGITLKGTTDKTINWVDATDAWTFSEHINIASAKEYRIAGTKVLDATSLGSGVINSSLTSVGTIGTGVWQGTAISDTYLATISTAGKVSNSATTATSANTASAIVARDASGNFSAGTITANLSGNASTVTTNANLTGDVTSVGNATSIAAGVIVNADVNASAAIAGTKISPDFGSQTITTTGIVSNALGTAAAPSITFTGDVNTGIYSPGADELAISTGGTGRLFVDASGRVGVGNTPTSLLDVSSTSEFTLGLLARTSSTQTSIGSHPIATFTNTSTASGNGVGARFNIADTSGTARVAAQIGAIATAKTASSVTADIYFAPGATERARIDSSGRLLVGTSSARTITVVPTFQIEGTGAVAGAFQSLVLNRNTDAAGPRFVFGRTRGTANGQFTAVQSGDSLGDLRWYGADGTTLESYAAEIRCEVDGTPGTNDMPGRIVLSTTADGASSPTERMRISNDGAVKIAGDNFQIATSKTPASATAAGTTGQVAWDASYIYVCTATNTWKRAALSTW